MKIGITGDTHGNMQAIRRIVAISPSVDIWLHTGDYASDANVLASQTGIKVVSVAGNCDIGTHATDAKPDEFIVLENYKIWLTHGHRYMQWNEKADMGYWAKQFDQDIVVYGHTHMPVCEYYGDALLINPGSPSRPRGGSDAQFAVLTLNKGETPEVEFIKL